MRYDDRTLAGVLFLFGSIEFILAMLVGEASLPTYSVSTDAISALGVGPTAPLFNGAVILLGLLVLGGTYFYHRTHRKLWITVPFLLAGIGPIGVGVFPGNTGAPHAVFAFVSFVFGGLVALVIASQVTSPFRYVSLILGVTGLVALVLFVAGQYAGLGLGGMERMIVYPVLLWEVAFGGYLVSGPRAIDAPAAPKGPAP